MEWLDSAARHLEQAVEPLQRAGESLSRLKLTPEAEDALQEALAAVELTDPDAEHWGSPAWKRQRGEA